MKTNTKKYVMTALFAAIIAVFAQIHIPLPSGIPLTLQTFAVALGGYLLSHTYGTLSVAIYILVGLVGVPVFSFFGAGPAVLFGNTGGFIWGFLLLAAACGLAGKQRKKSNKIILSLIGLLLCHTAGTVQFAAIYSTDIFAAFLVVSLPFLLKDALLVTAAYLLSASVKKRINIV